MNNIKLSELPKIALYAARILGFNTTKPNSRTESTQHQRGIVLSPTGVTEERYYRLRMNSAGITYNR
jgi:hypothetical protein